MQNFRLTYRLSLALLASALVTDLPMVVAQSADPVVGRYAGEWTGPGGTRQKLTAQIRSLGDGAYDGFLLLHEDRAVSAAIRIASPKTPAPGPLSLSGTSVALKKAELMPKVDAAVTVVNGKLSGNLSGDMGGGVVTAERFVQASPTLGAKPPEGAVVLFDGKDTSKWKNFSWEVTPEGTMKVAKGNITTIDKHKSFRLHLEFKLPAMLKATGQGRANSGVYLQSIYEVQVLDSFGLYPLQINDCGSVYGVAAATANGCLPPGEWQTYDIVFEEGDAASYGLPAITVQLNGVTTLSKVRVPKALVGKGGGGGMPDGGALMLQDHGNPIEFRNIWLVPGRH